MVQSVPLAAVRIRRGLLVNVLHPARAIDNRPYDREGTWCEFAESLIVIELLPAGMSRTPSPTRRWSGFGAFVGGGVRTPLIRTHSDVLCSAGCFGSLHCVLFGVVDLCYGGFLLIKFDSIQFFRDVI